MPTFKMTIQQCNLMNFGSFTVNYSYINIVYTSISAIIILACLVSDFLTPSKLPSFTDLSRRVSYRRDHST